MKLCITCGETTFKKISAEEYLKPIKDFFWVNTEGGFHGISKNYDSQGKLTEWYEIDESSEYFFYSFYVFLKYLKFTHTNDEKYQFDFEDGIDGRISFFESKDGDGIDFYDSYDGGISFTFNKLNVDESSNEEWFCLEIL